MSVASMYFFSLIYFYTFIKLMYLSSYVLSNPEKNHICMECDFQTRDRASLTRHRKRRHSYIPRPRSARVTVQVARTHAESEAPSTSTSSESLPLSPPLSLLTSLSSSLAPTPAPPVFSIDIASGFTGLSGPSEPSESYHDSGDGKFKSYISLPTSLLILIQCGLELTGRQDSLLVHQWIIIYHHRR